MTNKQLYNLVFENFVHAKRELIKEGYTKKHLDEVDFNEIFGRTKSLMQEKKIESLKRENEMLKKQLSKKQGLKEAGSMRAAGMGKQTGGAGSESIWNFLTKVGAKLGSTTAKADVIADELEKNNQLNSSDIDKFKFKYIRFKKSGLNDMQATEKALDELRMQNLAESKKRKRY